MPTTAKIIYREFYNVPRMFVVSYHGQQYLFYGTFDDSADEYPDVYQVYVLPGLAHHELSGSWDRLSERAERHLGEVLVKSVEFDESRRLAIDPRVIEEVAAVSS